MHDLPERGVGVIYAPGLEPLLAAGGDLIDVVEIEPQAFWFAGAGPGDIAAPARRIIEAAGLDHRPALVHGVGAPIGGTVTPTDDQMASLASIAAQLDSAWVSEHLSFNHARIHGQVAATGLMLPSPQTELSAELAASTITTYRQRLDRPFAFETGVNYRRTQPDEMRDGAWWRRVAERADCGIVLDLHNVWCNARNGRQSLDDLFDELPLDRVWEIHLAGGERVDGVWLDAHSGLVDDELLAIAATVIPHLPALRAVVFEIVPEYLLARDIGAPAIRAMLEEVHHLWDERRTRVGVAGTRPATTVRAPADVSPLARAESELALTVLEGQSDDPGVKVMGRLVEAIRRGLTVTVLPLSLRLLRLSTGPEAVEAVLAECWRRHPPELYADAEAAHVAAVARELFGDRAPHLDEVLDYELALVDLARTGAAPTVAFTCEPLELLGALGRGELPDALVPGVFELSVVA